MKNDDLEYLQSITEGEKSLEIAIELWEHFGELAFSHIMECYSPYKEKQNDEDMIEINKLIEENYLFKDTGPFNFNYIFGDADDLFDDEEILEKMEKKQWIEVFGKNFYFKGPKFEKASYKTKEHLYKIINWQK